ncbi:MAG: phage integrase SAM-like domain-containing protein [Phycisphaerales bacterium]|nr:MAG: phage integrase SAM-like domain-containing protein [Phycisphaerales bacterium]
MNKKVTVTPRWYGPVPTRGGKPLPKNQWARAGRKRKWTVRWYAPDGSRPRETFDTKEEAEEFARTKTSEFESRGMQARIRPKKVALEDFTVELRLQRIGPSGRRLSVGSSKSYQEVLTRFGKFVGLRTPLENITMADGVRYIASLRDGPSRRGRQMSTATINKHERTLKAAFNVAVLQLGYVNANPFTVLRQDKVGDQPLR